MQSLIVNLIKDYLNDVDFFMKSLRQLIGEENPIRAVRTKLIPKDGKLESENIQYSFHGRGCEVRKDQRIIDFDFGSNFRTDVFDVWRLWIYVESRKIDFPEYSKKEDLEKDFNDLIHKGMIKRDDYQYEDLYYLI